MGRNKKAKGLNVYLNGAKVGNLKKDPLGLISFNYSKERYAVGLMNVFDLDQAQTLFSNAQSEVIRTKYDYIFKVKVLEFYFGIPIIQKQ